jgi:hypothetical protein
VHRLDWCVAATQLCSPPPCGEGSGVGVHKALSQSVIDLFISPHYAPLRQTKCVNTLVNILHPQINLFDAVP